MARVKTTAPKGFVRLGLLVAALLGGVFQAQASLIEETQARGELQIHRSRKKVTINGLMLRVSKATRVVINEQEADLRELVSYSKANSPVLAEVEYSVATSPPLAMSIEVDDPAELASETVRVLGQLTAADAAVGTFTLQPSDGSETRTFTVDADTDFEIVYADLTLQQVQEFLAARKVITAQVECLRDSDVAEEVRLEFLLDSEAAVVRHFDRRTRMLTIGRRKSELRQIQLLPGAPVTRHLRLLLPQQLQRGKRIGIVSFPIGNQRFATSVAITK